MLLIGRNFYHGLDPLGVSLLADQLHLPAGVVKEFMEMFAQAKLVLPLADGETFVLGRDAETIGIKDILDCVRNSGKTLKTRSDGSREEDEVNRLIVKLDQSMAKVLEGKNLQELILSLAAPQDRR